MIGSMPLEEEAIALGIQIGQSAEYKALRRAEEEVGKDEDLRTLLQEFQGLQDQVIGMQAQGKQIPEDLRKRAEGMHMKIESQPLYQRMVAAQANYEKFMGKVNQHMAEGVKKGAAQKIITL